LPNTEHLPIVYVALSREIIEELELESYLQQLEQVAQLERWQGSGNPTLEAIEEAISRAQVLITGWGTPHLSMLQNWTPESSPLRLVVHSAGTVKYLLPKVALARGLIVTHANDSLAEAVAEFTVGAIIMARRQAFQMYERFKQGDRRLAPQAAHELRGSTVGIIAASAIGRRVMPLLAPFGVKILLYDPFCTPESATQFGAELVSLETLLRESDIVSLHAPVTEQTIGMLGKEQFAAMRDGALFVNTARGRLIDHDALLAELQSGRISALLDVTDPNEPLPIDSPFFKLSNCIVLPHIAAVTREARLRQSAITLAEVQRFLANQALQHQVTLARWETMA
jgi:Phosphoglycerate dehydrogenase and related dehydrogenases